MTDNYEGTEMDDKESLLRSPRGETGIRVITSVIGLIAAVIGLTEVFYRSDLIRGPSPIERAVDAGGTDGGAPADGDGRAGPGRSETQPAASPTTAPSVEAEQLFHGTVKWFSNEKGYGFISLPDGEDVYVHYSEIEGEGYRSLEQGQEVEFEVTDGSHGKQAVNVRVV